eukprot:TRINITY_DN3879_c0_g1_i1.p1 TRINITY_DN3879_c0_g1~~TRINITY_DN3879_c0_g1_i1.p1  ORF type:complete len:212 (+),score=43.22 TRINITY_DN3879_c0_g1_i1:226-861(+)
MEQQFFPSEALRSKLVVVGDSGVGKTSIVGRYITGIFDPTEPNTIGASFQTKAVVVGDKVTKLQIWDTAGQERFRSLAPMYYRGASAAVLVVDMTQKRSFESIRGWVDELRSNVHTDMVLRIACNKVDLESEVEVDIDEVVEFGELVGAKCFKTSAKLNIGIEPLFLDIVCALIERETALPEKKKRVELVDSKRSADSGRRSRDGEKGGCC